MIKRSIEIAWRSKWLWIYGILVGSGSSFNIGNAIPNELPAGFSDIERVFSNWIIQLSPQQIVAFFASIFIFALFTMIIGFVVPNWAHASLIFGGEQELNGKAANLSNTSPIGLKYFMKLIIFSSISFLIAAIAFPLLILLPGVLTYGSRAIVLKNCTPWNAWKVGLKMAWKYFFKTLKFGIISLVLSSLMGLGAMLLLLIVLGTPGFILYSVGIYLPILVLLLIFAWVSSIVTGFITVFKTTLWNQVFKEIWKE